MNRTTAFLAGWNMCLLLTSGCGAPSEPKQPTPRAASPSKTDAGAASQPSVPTEGKRRGFATAQMTRPNHFPHRIWAACDFQARMPDYGWFGTPETANIPAYPGNTTALRGQPAQPGAAYYVGINPVPGPRMGKHNMLYLRYFLGGSTSAQFQHFNLTRNDNHHIKVSDLAEGKWAELTLDFTNDSRRNDGSPGAMAEGDRMDDLKIFLGQLGDAKPYAMIVDDIIFFSDDPAAPPDPEPFPNRVIYLAAFDTGPKEKYWPGEFELADSRLPPGTYWRAARAVLHNGGPEKWIRLKIEPPRPVGQTTKLRFRYHLTGTGSMTVQIFDLTDMDNRHVRLTNLAQGQWQQGNLNFTADARRNDGTNTPFAAGHNVDDIFFFVSPDQNDPVDLLIDEVVLYDAGKPPG